ncbi:hypothetical protein [Demequina litorisediminis]|uniref:hypothetical protein n=1 Tax=Demequina litorisediminis TaxID=1849022 RepID=UPI0024E160A1|nr:hypothetical protein [Demequina litorisediminis]
MGGASIGWGASALIGPWTPEKDFWHPFLTGPPAAGLFALVGAVIAYFAAGKASQVARDTGAREAWWSRAGWAIEMARADAVADRLLGIRALGVLIDSGSEEDGEMIVGFLEETVLRAVDSEPAATDNDEEGGA